MNVCLIHVRISVAPDELVPKVSFKSRLLETGESLRHRFNSLADLHVNNLGMEYTNISPMKPSKTKADQPKDISLDSMSETEKAEIAEKLKGRRNFKEITVETYGRKPETIDEEIESSLDGSLVSDETSIERNPTESPKRSESRGGEDGVKGEVKKLKESKKKNKVQAVEEDLTDRRSYAEAVTVTTQELLRRSSNSVSSSKDDYELSEILHMSEAVASAASSRPSSSLERYTPTSRAPIETSVHPSPFPAERVPFFSGNPAVEITHGIIHLYKTNYMMKVGEDLPSLPTYTLCMLAVPGTVDTHFILEFTAAFCDTITRIRIIRDRTPSQYMALITFASERAASEFYHTYNNVPFSSLTPDEVCRLTFVASVEALTAVHEKGNRDSTGMLPIMDSTELPDCVLCLERMDESVRGVLTILCNHTFHGDCLQKWNDLCCPVCRYIQTPEPRTDNKCLVCGSQEDLWICLVCGHVGCGRYTSEHAQQHYIETQHNYAMALSDNRVWDYAGDYFVHRLFQNKEDGKLVEQKAPDGNAEERAFKVEAIQLECMYLLTSQLESQRKYWEERLSSVEESAARDGESTRLQLVEASEKCDQLDRKLTALEKEKCHIEKKNQQLATKYAHSIRELATERELNEGLRKNQEDWRSKVNRLELRATEQQREIADLKDQLRDVMFYLEAQKTLDGVDEETREEVQGGQITVGAASGHKKKRKPKKK